MHVESWRTTYGGVVPQPYLNSLSEWERADRWRETLGRDDEVFVAEQDGRTVGFAMGGPSRDGVEGCDAELYAIYLLAEAQRAGVGTDLLHELARSLCESGFASMDVWVLEANPARFFYERMGAHAAGSKEIEIGGATLMKRAYVWPDLKALAASSFRAAALSRQ
ncbi:MAG: N-acetyltransferase family protein [Acidobacteriota bacterium]